MSGPDPRDTLFATPREWVADFAFDEEVVGVFPDMIRRSVPGYGNLITFSGMMAAEYLQEGSRVYDLGCSLGASTLALLRCRQQEIVQIIGVDNSSSMIEQCRENIRREGWQDQVELVCADLTDVAIHNASVVMMNFTLQFLAREQRADILARIYQGLNPGGLFILSEKVRFTDEQENDFQVQLHHRFKMANGYSELEISQKRSALEKVLLPETLDTHIERLRAAGFSQIYPWFQAFNFVSIAALK